MGLLDGVQSLQGAPAPSQSQSRSGSENGNNNGDAMAQFSEGAKSLFGDLGSTLGEGAENLGGGMKSGVNSLRRMMGDESVEPDLESGTVQMSLSEEMGSMLNLTLFQRLGLFAMCFATGLLLMFISFSFLPLVMVMPHKFAAAFAMGNFLCIASTWVLVGPRAQLQTMFHPVRAVAAGVYVVSLVFTMLAALFGGRLRYILMIISIVAEVASCKFSCLASTFSSCSMMGVYIFTNTNMSFLSVHCFERFSYIYIQYAGTR